MSTYSLKLSTGNSHLWQWDTGQAVIVSGNVAQVHFARKDLDVAYVAEVSSGRAAIPDALLQASGTLVAYAYTPTNTLFSARWRVWPRQKPETYPYQDTDIDLKTIDDRFTDMQEWVKNQFGSPLTASTAAGMTDTTKVYVYTGSETGYTNGNWYYWDGTEWTSGGIYNAVAFTTDDTLSVTGKAADAAKTGEELSKLKSDVNGISSATSNLFNSHDITIGMNAAGTTGYPKRAISGAMNVGDNGAKIKVWAIPETLQFDIERYSEENISSRVGYDSVNGWISQSGEYTYNYSSPFVRFLFARRDDENISESDFEGLKLQVNKGRVIRDYEPYLTATDVYARRNIAAVIDASNIYGILPYTDYKQGSYNLTTGEDYYDTSRIISDYIEVEPGSILIGEKIDPSTTFKVSVFCFDCARNYVRGSNYLELFEGGYKVGAETRYVRFVMRKFVNEIYVDLLPEESTNSKLRVRYKGCSLQPSNLKVMTYNVGKWNYGLTHGIPASIYDEKLLNYKRFFGSMDCDVIGMQECTRLIDEAQTIDVRSVLFDHWYQNSEITGNWEAIYSKFPISSGGNGQISNGRYYVYTYMQYEDKAIYLLNVHLSPGYGSEAQAKRRQEMQEILALVADKSRFIIFGDFNPEPGEYKSLFEMAETAGYNLANSGFFGDFWTWTSNQDDFSSDTPTGVLYTLDNIITSANIKINSAQRINTYTDLTSDHIPIIAELSVL